MEGHNHLDEAKRYVGYFRGHIARGSGLQLELLLESLDHEIREGNLSLAVIGTDEQEMQKFGEYVALKNKKTD